MDRATTQVVDRLLEAGWTPPAPRSLPEPDGDAHISGQDLGDRIKLALGCYNPDHVDRVLAEVEQYCRWREGAAQDEIAGYSADIGDARRDCQEAARLLRDEREARRLAERALAAVRRDLAQVTAQRDQFDGDRHNEAERNMELHEATIDLRQRAETAERERDEAHRVRDQLRDELAGAVAFTGPLPGCTVCGEEGTQCCVPPDERYAVVKGWLCAVRAECTCCGCDQYGHEAHEPGCGLENLCTLDQLDALLADADAAATEESTAAPKPAPRPRTARPIEEPGRVVVDLGYLSLPADIQQGLEEDFAAITEAQREALSQTFPPVSSTVPIQNCQTCGGPATGGHIPDMGDPSTARWWCEWHDPKIDREARNG